MLGTSSILRCAASQLALDYCAHRQVLGEEQFYLDCHRSFSRHLFQRGKVRRNVGRVDVKILSCCTTGPTAACKLGNKSFLGRGAQSCSSQLQRAVPAHRYLSTLLYATACQVLPFAHVLCDAFSRICRLRGETAGIYPCYPKSTF
jgi:hypothetical protein